MTLPRLWFSKFGEAWTACMVCMVQGDLSVVSLDHMIVASQTGAGCATAVTLCAWRGVTNEWVQVWLTGIFTLIFDAMTGWSVSIVQNIGTATGAMILAVITQKSLRRSNEQTTKR